MRYLAKSTRRRVTVFIAALALSGSAKPQVVATPGDEVSIKLATEIFKQLIEINTTDSVGSTTTAADAMAKRLRDAGFPADDVVVMGPNPRKGNVVARLRGIGAHKPVLLIGHLDVVEAKRSDWSTDPFQFIAKKGYYYGRGTQDMKDGDAIMMATLIRMKQEGYKPDRDIILALTADEEGGSFNGVDWLVKNHRDMVDAEFVLNHDGGGGEVENGKLLGFTVDATEKLYADYQFSSLNAGGHSSMPTPDNAIYHLADALAAGMPSFGIQGVALDNNDIRAHGKDERLPIQSFETGVQFYYRYLKALTSDK